MHNLAEKVDKCLLNLFVHNWDHKNCLLYGVVGCLLFRGYLSIEVNGKTVGPFEIICYIVGCLLLRGVR